MELQLPGGWRRLPDCLGQSWSTVSVQGVSRLVGSREERAGCTVGVAGAPGMERIPLYKPSTPPCTAQARQLRAACAHIGLKKTVIGTGDRLTLSEPLLSQELKKTCGQMLEKSMPGRHLSQMKTMWAKH